MNSFYTEPELRQLGFRRLGKNVQLSRKASLYGAEQMCIGSNVRIDDFCILSGRITLGSHIHISAYTALFGGDAGIGLQDFTTVSSRCAIYALSDDFSGSTMTNPTVPHRCRGVRQSPVTVEKHAVIGTGCTVLPGVRIGEGAAVGCMSLVNRSLAPWGIYAGIPCRRLKGRSRALTALEGEI